MKYLPGIGVLTIFVRNMTRGGMTQEQIAAKMKQRLNLERFDVATLDDEDRKRYEELSEFLRGLEGNTAQEI